MADVSSVRQPFDNYDEFLTVAQLIIYNDHISLQKAYNTLYVWCTRFPESKVPRSIYSTFKLLDAYYFSKNNYALPMALCRFVNSITSELDDTNNLNFRIPLSSSSKHFMLPASTVQTRQQVSHPFQFKLDIERSYRLEFQDSLKWLIDNFWKPNFDYITRNWFLKESDVKKYLNDHMIDGVVTKELKEYIRSFKGKENVIIFFDYLLSDKCMLNQFDSEQWENLIKTLLFENHIDIIINKLFQLFFNDPSNQIIYSWCDIFLNSLDKNSKDSCDKKFSFHIKCSNLRSVDWSEILDLFLQYCCDAKFESMLQKILSTFSDQQRSNNVIKRFKRNIRKRKSSSVNEESPLKQ